MSSTPALQTYSNSKRTLDYAGYADKLEGDAFPPDDGVYKIVQYEPLGVVASIASWNMTPL